MRKLALGTAIVALVFGGFVLVYTALQARQPQPAMGNMADGGVSSAGLAPLVKGFYRGREVQFIHTEASDPQVAEMLTRMMGPKVVLVPNLAQAPTSLLAPVYVFTNGVRGEGPFGFQPDVFPSVPGDAGYTPLRTVLLAGWKEGMSPRELRSAEEVQAAEARGEIATTRSGAVVNMPILIWPGGRR